MNPFDEHDALIERDLAAEDVTAASSSVMSHGPGSRDDIMGLRAAAAVGAAPVDPEAIVLAAFAKSEGSRTSVQSHVGVPRRDSKSDARTAMRGVLRARSEGRPIVKWASAFGGVFLGALFVAFFFMPQWRPRDRGVTRTYATTTGQRATVSLSDGTRVTLGPRSVLRLVGFGRDVRTVALDAGEAYFDVAHADGAPFIVRGSRAAVRVLGTKFLVRHEESGERLRVSVETGKVALAATAHRGQDIALAAGNAAEITDSTVVLKSVSNFAPDTGWLHDAIVFQDAPMSEVLATLHRWYGYEFHCADPSIARRSVTIIVSTRSSTEALSTLQQLLNVSLQVTGDTVTLTPNSKQKVGRPRTKSYDVWTPTKEVGR